MIRLFCIKFSQIGHLISPFKHSNAYLFSPYSQKFIINLSNYRFSHSFTLSYLQESCGLSLEAATSAAQKLQLETRENPDLVLNLLRTHGFTQAHIKNYVTYSPSLLLADLNNTLMPNFELFKSLGFSGTSLAKLVSKNSRILEVDAKTVVEFFRENAFSEEQIATLTVKRPVLYFYNLRKTFKPKLEFFKSLGFSEFDVARILSREPYILQRSMENRIVPCIQILRRVVGNDLNVQKAIKACYTILEIKLEEMLEQNKSMLLHQGVPESLILQRFLIQPRYLLLKTDRLKEIIGEVKKLGFNPATFTFMLAISIKATVNRRLWEKKLELYRSFGLSNDEIDLAFRLQPMCMVTSLEKIRKMMNFYVNILKIKPSVISKDPNIILLSLEKRIIPRCSVLHILMSKGFIKEDVSLINVFRITEKMFMEKLVTKYQDLVPEVVNAHQGRIKFQGFLGELKI